MIFADTSGLFAAVDKDDIRHARAKQFLAGLVEDHAEIVSTNYVAVELLALVQRRLGMNAVRTVVEDILPEIDVRFTDEALHRAGLDLFIRERRRRLSLVDCISVTFMRRAGIRQAFAFDRDFQSFGIELF